MEGDILTEHPRSQKTGKFAARAELKAATSLSDAGMADCRVRRVDEAGSNRRESNSCMHVTRYCTHCSSFRIRFGPHSTCSSWHLFGWPGRCETPWSEPHCSHLWSALLILEDGEPARLQQGNEDVHGMISN